MKEYRVLITDEAILDMEAIHQYIENDLFNPGAADRIYDLLLEKIINKLR